MSVVSAEAWVCRFGATSHIARCTAAILYYSPSLGVYISHVASSHTCVIKTEMVVLLLDDIIGVATMGMC